MIKSKNGVSSLFYPEWILGGPPCWWFTPYLCAWPLYCWEVQCFANFRLFEHIHLLPSQTRLCIFAIPSPGQACYQLYLKSLKWIIMCGCYFHWWQLGDGLRYDNVEGLGEFPHFYGPNGTFCPLPLSAVEASAKVKLESGKHILPFVSTDSWYYISYESPNVHHPWILGLIVRILLLLGLFHGVRCSRITLWEWQALKLCLQIHSLWHGVYQCLSQIQNSNQNKISKGTD